MIGYNGPCMAQFNNNMGRIFRLLAGMGLIWLAIGCATTRITDSRHDPLFRHGPFKGILVLGALSPEVDRRVYEDGLVQALVDQGGRGFKGYTLMPDASDYDDEEKIGAAMKQAGADAVMIATLAGVEEKERSIPQRVRYRPFILCRHGGYECCGLFREPGHGPEYTVTDTIVRLDIAVFSAATEKMVWSGTTKSVNPGSGERLTREAAGLIVEDLKQAGLL